MTLWVMIFRGKGAAMPTVMMCKIPFESQKFRNHQKVWVVNTSGSEAFKVCGKFRGKYRYVTAWINWRATHKPCPEWKKIEVSREFAATHNLLVTNT